VTTATLQIEFERPTKISQLLVQEYSPLGQRIKRWNVEAEVNGQWQPVAEATTIGFRRIVKFEPVTTPRLRLNLLDSYAPPALSRISLY
jgi:alpha-L-fucosidase